MAPDGIDETGLNIILEPRLPQTGRETIRSEARSARTSEASARLVRRLENTVLVLGPLAVAVGVFLITYDVALALLPYRR